MAEALSEGALFQGGLTRCRELAGGRRGKHPGDFGRKKGHPQKQDCGVHPRETGDFGRREGTLAVGGKGAPSGWTGGDRGASGEQAGRNRVKGLGRSSG